MESHRILIIDDWPTPKLVRDVQVLLGCTNFYQPVICKYTKLTAPFSDFLKKLLGKWEWTRSSRAVRDTPVADNSAPGDYTTSHVAYCPPITVSPFLLALSVSNFT